MGEHITDQGEPLCTTVGGWLCGRAMKSLRSRAGYLQMVRLEPNRWVVVNAGRDWQSVQDELMKIILKKVERSK